MRLLHTTALAFKEFFDDQIPSYTILSHRWGENEVSFQDLQAAIREKNFEAERFSKILQCCSVSKTHGYDWTWIDTCCINKDSSAELTEAINSMYRWYKNAAGCYVFMNDVLWEGEPLLFRRYRMLDEMVFTKDESDPSRESFRKSQWFTRGWTLQELLAPNRLLFYDSRGVFIGEKFDLARDIEMVTKIDVKYLRKSTDPVEASVARKMSWASKRRTSRVEDTAYCLLGLFNVNMPLLYGEGPKAFMRLQLEILNVSDDETIFAWRSKNRYWRGLLAPWPDAFEDSRHMEIHSMLPGDRLPYAMTNKGLRLNLNISREEWDSLRGKIGETNQILLTLVNCYEASEGFSSCQNIGILLQESERPLPYRGVDYWDRADCTQLHFRPFGLPTDLSLSDAKILDEKNTTTIYIRQYRL